MIDARCIGRDVGDHYFSASIMQAPWLTESLTRYEELRATRFHDSLGPLERRDYESDPGLFARHVVGTGDGNAFPPILPDGVRDEVQRALERCTWDLAKPQAGLRAPRSGVSLRRNG